MRYYSEEKAIVAFFFLSLLLHIILFWLPKFNLTSSPEILEENEEIIIELQFEKPPLLPKIDILGKEKKVKEPVKEDMPELEPQAQTPKNIEEPKEKEEVEDSAIEEIANKKYIPEPKEEFIEVKNPQDEAILRYQDMIKQKIESSRRYPSWAKKQGLEGAACIRFTTLLSGEVANISLIKSSGINILDSAAVATVKRASPFMPIPGDLKRSSLTMDVAIVFQIN